MPSLTPKLLETFPYSQYADPQSIQRGRAYYKDGRVWSVELVNNYEAICLIEGDSDEYTVEIEVDRKSGNLTFDCDCPYADEGNFCKHMVAAALELKDQLSEGMIDFDDEADGILPPAPSGNWQNKLKETLALAPHRASTTAGKYNRYIGLTILTRSQLYNNYGYGSANRISYSYSLEPFVVTANQWDLLQGDQPPTPQEINQLLNSNSKWFKLGDRLYQQMNPLGCLNLSADGVAFLNILQNFSRIYGGVISNISMYLSMLGRLGIPIFLGKTDYPQKLERRLRILPNPVDIKIDLQSDESKLTLQAGFENEGAFTLVKNKIETISSNPTWVLMDDTLAQIQNTQALAILPSFPIVIPAQQADIFREQYFAQIAQLLPIKSDIIHWQDVNAEPTPRLYLHDDKRSSPADKDKTLRADLRFGYGEHELPLGKEDSYTVETVPDSWDLIRIHRQNQREQYFYQLLTDPSYRLKRAGNNYPYGTLELRARAHPFDFLLHSIPQLTQAGFEIYGEDDLKLGRINRNIATLRVSITSGIDWFDLKTFVEFGDQQISFHDVRKALKRKENYIKLADGSVGQIPAEWLEKYKHLWNMAEETEDGFRVSDFHLPLLDKLLEDDETLHPPSELIQRRERFRHFERIAPQPLPKNFTGELASLPKTWLRLAALFE